jgi:NAD(P)H-flavin reductase
MDETRDTATLDLEPATEVVVPQFAPGQFAMLYAFGIGEAPISVCGTEDGRLRHTIRAVGPVSTALRSLRAGDPVGVRGPFGNGWDPAAATGRDLVIVAGGLGLAPLRPALLQALAGREPHRAVSLLIGARTPGDLLYARELDGWRAAGANVLVTVDRPDPDWTGDVGVVTTLLDRARFDPATAYAWICGPEVMIRATARELSHRGLDENRIRVSLERNMHCGTGHCGHCQLGPLLLCRDGPVVAWSRARSLTTVPEL